VLKERMCEKNLYLLLHPNCRELAQVVQTSLQVYLKWSYIVNVERQNKGHKGNYYFVFPRLNLRNGTNK